MTSETPLRWTRGLAAALALTFVAGCATVPVASKPPEVAVRERATQRWAALIAGELDKAYALMPPSHRAVTSFEAYRRGFQGAVKWTGAEVAWVKCETTDKCVAHMKVDATILFPRGAPPLTNYFDETWIREDGQWWLFPTP